MKLDLHVHTNKSSDAHTRLDELAPNIQRAGLDGLAITDHNILSTDTLEETIVIPGIEISSRDGHMIGLGIPRPVPRGLSADQTIREIRNMGGVSIVAHPYDMFRSAIKPDILTTMPDAIEVINSASILHSVTWKRARTFAEEKQLPHSRDHRQGIHNHRMRVEDYRISSRCDQERGHDARRTSLQSGRPAAKTSETRLGSLQVFHLVQWDPQTDEAGFRVTAAQFNVGQIFSRIVRFHL